MSVMAKYADYTGNELKPSAISFGAMFLQALGIPTTGENAIDPSLFESAGGALATENDNNTGGAYAYINYIFYDKNFEEKALVGFDRTTTAAANSFEELSLTFTAEKEGYLFVYLSNEEPTAVEAYFDDFKIVHTPTIVAQTDSYYPFGLSHGNMSMVREGRAENQFLYNGKELVEGFELGWYDYGARYYAPDLGRWHAVDPLAGRYYKFSPYVYVGNSPIIAIDPDGKKILFVNGYWMDNWIGKNIIGSTTSGKGYWGLGFTEAAQRFYNDYSSVSDANYIDGSSNYGGDMSGSEREEAGYAYAKENYCSLVADLEEDETFKLVTHSEGGAYGAGIARYLVEKGHKVETILHLSTDEADEFENPENTKTYQLGYGGDWVTGNKEVRGADIFGVVDKYSNTSDKVQYAHGSTKSADVFKYVKAMLKAAAEGATGVNITETSSKIKFEFIRTKDDDEKKN
jgi:RHS repeat-associated protein